MSDVTRSKSGRFVDDLNDAVRQNPIAASLIGMGALWMLFGGAKIPAFAPKVSDAARAAAGAIGSATQATAQAASGISAAGSQAIDAARQTASRMVHSGATAVGDGSETVADTLGDAADGLRGTFKTSAATGKEFATSMQKNLSETLDRQPLVLGAIGLAIGAGIASAFPATTVEKDLMGETSAAVRDRLEGAAGDATVFAKDRANEVLREVKKEAAAQGLTPSAAAEVVKGVKQKAKTVAGTARNSVKERLR
jgi:hypothetical protein